MHLVWPQTNALVSLFPSRMWVACTRGKSRAPSFLGVPEASRPVSAGLSRGGALGGRGGVSRAGQLPPARGTLPKRLRDGGGGVLARAARGDGVLGESGYLRVRRGAHDIKDGRSPVSVFFFHQQSWGFRSSSVAVVRKVHMSECVK